MRPKKTPLLLYFSEERMLADFQRAYNEFADNPFVVDNDWDLIDWKPIEDELARQIWLIRPQVGDEFSITIPPTMTRSEREEELFVGTVMEVPIPSKESAQDPRNWVGDIYRGGEWHGYYSLVRKLSD